MHLLSRLRSLVLPIMVAVLPAFAGEPLLPAPVVSDYIFHGAQPLGVDAFVLAGRKQPVSVLATALSPEMEGWSRVRQGRNVYILDVAGQRVEHFPENLQFRVTLSGNGRVMPMVTPVAVKSDENVNEYLLKVRFRLKIFHELRSRELEPTEVHVMGVPSNVPYEERIYRLSFQLPKVPISDRMILEVLSPEGERIMRFHFELM